jgi:hypothetical protein
MPALIVLMMRCLFRQARLLRDGRATLARVTKVEKRSDGHETRWRVHYEWTALSGAVQTGRQDKHKAPAVGAVIPVIYDKDNPRHSAVYPLTFVRVVAW